MTIWRQTKGKCLMCDRVRKGNKHVLRYKENHGRHYLNCIVCDSEYSANSKAEVIRQKGVR